MKQLSTAASFCLDDGRRFAFTIELGEQGWTLTAEGQATVSRDGEDLLAKLLSLTGPLAETEAEDVRGLMSHQLTCLGYYGGPEEER